MIYRLEGGTPEEDIAGWLSRLEIPIEEAATLEDLQDYLRDELGYGDDQIDALTSGWIQSHDFESAGIHALTVTYPWGKELRYGIKGAPGLWGFESAMRFFYERTEEAE